MKTSLKNFNNGLKENRTFYLNSFRGQGTAFSFPETSIVLDKEDIEYFKNKYLPRLESEMEEEINKITQEYSRCSKSSENVNSVIKIDQ